MERGSIALLHTLVGDCFDPYKTLPNESKLNVIRTFFFQFGYLNTCYLSAKYYPEINDSRMCIHYGYYLSPTTLPYFFEGLADIEEHIK
jgi:hypothetical protein